MKNLLTISLLTLLLTLSCKCNTENNKEIDLKPTANVLDTLVSGQYNYRNDVFGECIELTGKGVDVDAIFTPNGEIIVNDSLLIVKNNSSNNTHIIYIFRKSDFKFLAKVGSIGRGPFEFRYPEIFLSHTDSVIAYIHERTTEKLFYLTPQFTIKECYSPFEESTSFWGHKKDIINLSENDYVYESLSHNGKKIARYTYDKLSKESIRTDIVDLYFNPDIKYDAYFGSLTANPSKNRIVYGYLFFNRVVFSDMTGESVRIVEFPDNNKYDNKASGWVDATNHYPVYYYDVKAGDDYVYLQCRGGLNAIKLREQRGIDSNNFLEIWDWNGNPIKKLKLDQFGPIAVDEKERKIYLLSFSSDIPFYVYDLPEL